MAVAAFDQMGDGEASPLIVVHAHRTHAGRVELVVHQHERRAPPRQLDDGRLPTGGTPAQHPLDPVRLQLPE